MAAEEREEAGDGVGLTLDEAIVVVSVVSSEGILFEGELSTSSDK